MSVLTFNECKTRSNSVAPVDLDSIERRSNISKLIQTGDTENALEIVRLLDPKLLKEDKHLFFQLHKQILLDFISHGEAIQALQYARTELADFIVENVRFSLSLERWCLTVG